MPRPLPQTLLRLLPAICGGTVAVVGLSAFAGGGIGLVLSPVVALGLILMGAALLCFGAPAPLGQLVGRVLAAGTFLLGAGCGGQSLWLLVGPAASPAGTATLPVQPVFMALGTALAFVFGSLALLTTIRTPRRWWLGWSAWFTILLLADALIPVMAFLFGSEEFPLASGELLRMGLPPAVAHLLLGLGLVALRPKSDLLQVFTAKSAAGFVARRMILIVLVLPPVLVGLREYLFATRGLGTKDGQAFFTVIYMLAGTLVTFWAARIAARLETERAQAEDEQSRLLARLQEQTARLQEEVATRTLELVNANRDLLAAAQLNTRLSLVASHTTSGVVIADDQGRIEWTNKAWEQMTGYSLSEVLGRKPGHLLKGPGTDAVITARLRTAVQQGQPCYEEILNYAKDGRPFWQILDIEPVKNETGKLVNFISVQTDITQYHESQQQLQGLTDRLQLALHFSGYGVWEVEVPTGRMTWDARMHEIYGLPAGQFDGRRQSWHRCLHPDDLARAEQKFADLLAGKASSYEIEYRIVRPADGEARYLEAQGFLQRDGNGQPRRVVGLNRDITAEYEQREQLRANTERMQLALRASGSGVWDTDLVNGIMYWDSRQCEIYGTPPGSVNGTATDVWINLIHPDDRESILEELQLRWEIETAEDFFHEYRIIRPDGKVRHVEAHGHLRRDAAGRPIRATGVDRDVTAEKEMQEALRLAEERWQLAITSTTDGVWDWNLASGSLFFDQRYCEILGYGAGELPGDDAGWMLLVHPDDLTLTMTAREIHLAGRTPVYAVEHRMRARSGDWKWVLNRGKVVTRQAGRAERMVGTLSDISARKALEQTQRRNQELADHVGRLALIGGWEYQLPDNTLYWSPSMRRIHEVRDDYIPTVESSLGFYPPETRAMVEAAFNRCVNEGEPYDLELPLMTASGRRIWVRTLGRAESVGARRIRVFGAFQDITTRHETEEARRQLETQLFQVQKMDTLGTLAGGIAHDFNNLLTGIMGYHDLALDLLPEEHQVRNYLGEARQASLRARELVDQILTFSRQHETPERMPLDLTLLVSEAQRFLRATLPATIQIQVELEPNCPRVLGDGTQLHQVLLNLGTNGAQAMAPRGGILKFTLAKILLDAAQAAALGGLSPGSFVCLAISDWGHGIDDVTLRRIFDPFFTTKKPGEGTGLGLSVVHGIVRSHQGGIEVESQVGVGTTFRIYLPEAMSEAQAEQEPTTLVSRGQSGRIFLVDDEELVARFSGIALERLGYTVVTFSSALPCLEAIRADPTVCDMLVTDYTMPGLSGIDLIEAAQKIIPTLNVVLTSGYFTKISAEALERLSHVELLNKPFTSEELARAVQRAMSVPLA